MRIITNTRYRQLGGVISDVAFVPLAACGCVRYQQIKITLPHVGRKLGPCFLTNEKLLLLNCRQIPPFKQKGFSKFTASLWMECTSGRKRPLTRTVNLRDVRFKGLWPHHLIRFFHVFFLYGFSHL